MPAFFTATVNVRNDLPDGSELPPIVLVEAFERDREVILRCDGEGLRLGFTEDEVETDPQGFPIPINATVKLFRFVLPARQELWARESVSGDVLVHVMVAAI